jgi:C4-dicarboxylate-specific signal transduction histidine kinase
VSDKTIKILEKQREDLLVRVLKKHEEMESWRFFTDRILSGLSEFFILLDGDFRIIQVNREFVHRTAYPSPTTEQSLELDALFTQATGGKIRAMFANNDSGEMEAGLRTASGELLPVKIRATSHTASDGRPLHMLILTDCSEFYEMMAQLYDGQRQIIHASRLASLGEMAAGVSHELTQPLNAILLFAKNALKALDAPGDHREMIRENLHIIIDRVNKASSIIGAMRNFGRKAEADLAPVELNGLIRKILAFLEPQFRLGEIEVELALTGAPCLVLGVDVRFEQVFLNLAQNAILAMGRVASPKLSIASRFTENLNIETLRLETKVLITVTDNGCGIAPEHQKKIFDPFFTTREAGLGTGLGLSIVDTIVRGFGGHIEVESAVDKGSCFSVYLPRQKTEDGEQRTEKSPAWNDMEENV